MAMTTCNRCGHTVCNCELLGDLCPKCKGPCACKATSVYYAPASQLNSVLKDVQAGKLYGVIPTAIDKTAVIKVLPTKESSTQIQPYVKEFQPPKGGTQAINRAPKLIIKKLNQQIRNDLMK